MTLDKLEEFINVEITAGKYPTKCRLHPATMALILKDFQDKNLARESQNSLREMSGKQGVVQLTDDRAAVQNALYFVEDDTIPEGEVRLT